MSCVEKEERRKGRAAVHTFVVAQVSGSQLPFLLLLLYIFFFFRFMAAVVVSGDISVGSSGKKTSIEN